MSKELYDNLPEVDANGESLQSLRESAAKFVPAEKQYQEPIKQKLNKIADQTESLSEQQEASTINVTQVADRTDLKNQINELEVQKNNLAKELETKSAELQAAQQTNAQLDKQTEDEKVIIDKAQAEHTTAEQDQVVNSTENADRALAGADDNS